VFWRTEKSLARVGIRKPVRPFGTAVTALYGINPTILVLLVCGSQNKQRLFPITALTDWF